jgi:4-oxalocrotonate tautomerase
MLNVEYCLGCYPLRAKLLRRELSMPHIIVKLWPGKTEQQKSLFAEKIVKDAMEILGSKEDSLSVAIEEIKSEDWAGEVYKPEIEPQLSKLYKKPGYKM